MGVRGLIRMQYEKPHVKPEKRIIEKLIRENRKRFPNLSEAQLRIKLYNLLAYGKRMKKNK